MFNTLTTAFSRLAVRPSLAGPSSLNAATRIGNGAVGGPSSSLLATSSRSQMLLPRLSGGVRTAAQLAPRRTKYRKAHKGRVALPIGGSLKGTTLSEGAYGIRLLEPARLSAKQLQAAEVALKRKLKVIKGAQVFMRVFPDIPVCVKGNETRMGKGKGSFEFWACRASVGRVIFELGGPVDIRPEMAKEALRLAAAKLPVKTEFITRDSAPRLGRIVETSIPPGSASTPGGLGAAGLKAPAASPESVTVVASSSPVVVSTQ